MSRYVLALITALLFAPAASAEPAASPYSDFGRIAIGGSWRTLPAELHPSKACLDAQAKDDRPCETTDSAGVTYLIFDNHVSAKEIRARNANPPPALPYGFAWSDTPADAERKLRELFRLPKLLVQAHDGGKAIDTGECFRAKLGDYFRLYLLYDSDQRLQALGTALCAWL